MTSRYFLTVAERLDQPPVTSLELMPSPSMYDELLRPLWWTPKGIVLMTQSGPQPLSGSPDTATANPPSREGED